jgi:hypothetical protein
MRDEINQEQRQLRGVLRRAVHDQPQQLPSPDVYERILADVKAQPAPHARPERSWVAMPALTLGLIALAVALLWQALPPGLVLQWSVDGTTPTQFQIYRALAAGSSTPDESDFVLLSELEARPGEAAYEYVDVRLLPGRSYAYRLEALDDTGFRSTSQTVVRHSQDALLGQIALLSAVTIALGYLWLLIQQLLRHGARPRVGAW